ncbi:hypothetical protein TNCV_233201 [Trichonephila clavipes]|nr:hypothetical protein TNCV_233201 [Trichonephila clavipes]
MCLLQSTFGTRVFLSLIKLLTEHFTAGHPKTVSLHSFSPPPATPCSTGACPPGGASDRGSATGEAWREDLVGPSLSLACVRRGSRSSSFSFALIISLLPSFFSSAPRFEKVCDLE